MRATFDPVSTRPPVGSAGDATPLRAGPYAPPRRRWPGILALCVLASAATALAVSSYYDPRTVGQKLDASVQAAGDTVRDQTQGVRDGAAAAARDGALATERATGALGDAGITAAVKTSLAADPHLSALKIDVKTEGGVVTLQGPAPDLRSRERAEVLAAAPDGVVRVDNRLLVTPASAR